MRMHYRLHHEEEEIQEVEPIELETEEKAGAENA